MKGYTLIELLAVIVILAIILIIAVPVINYVIEETKKSAFEISVKHIIKAGDYTYGSELFKPKRELVFIFEDREITANFPDATLDFSGEVPISGNLIIREDGKIAASLFNGKYCASKDYNETKVTIKDVGIEDCYSEISLPEVVLNGTTPVSVEIHNNYVDLGAIARTIGGEEITEIDAKIVKDTVEVPSIDTSILGAYRIVYTVYEGLKTNYVEREVNVIDTIKPVLTVPTSTSIVISEVNTFDFLAGVSVSDNSLETLTVNVSGGISRIAGSYIITYSATDSSGNTEEVTRMINVNDVSAPVITLNGESIINLNVGNAYTELSATSTDDADGDLTSTIVKTGSVNTSVPGTYFITYTSTDSSNNESSITRTINVIDNINPVVTFGTNGNATYAKTRSTTVTVTDNVAVQSRYYQWTTSTTTPTSGSFSQTLTNGATISTPAGVSGSYYLWIKAVDTNNNEVITRTNLFNLDNTEPVVTFGTNGNATYAKTRSTTVTVTDNVAVQSRYYQWTTSTTSPTSASFSTTFTNGASLSTPVGVTGTYYLWIKTVDTSSNEAIIRTNVFNLDNTVPVITLIGGSSIDVDTNSTFTDPGFTATDNINGNITASVVATGTVNTAVVGTYTRTYNVSDSSGNAATTVTRTVIVKNIILKSTGTAIVNATDTISVTGLPFKPVLVVVTGAEYGRLDMQYKMTLSMASTPVATSQLISSNWATRTYIGNGAMSSTANGFTYTIGDGGSSTFGQGNSVTWYAYSKVTTGTAVVGANDTITVSGLGFTPSVVVVSGTLRDFMLETSVGTVTVASTPLATIKVDSIPQANGGINISYGNCSKYSGGFSYTLSNAYANAKFGEGYTVTWYAYE